MSDAETRSSEQLPEGKIPPRVLREVLRRLGGGAGLDPGPASGEDAAVAAAGNEPRIVLAADPITFPSADPGWHAVIVNANDVAATGGEPRWFLSSILVPPGPMRRASYGSPTAFGTAAAKSAQRPPVATPKSPRPCVTRSSPGP